MHNFFRGVDWKNLQSRVPPNKPTLKNELDTQNFDVLEETMPHGPIQDAIKRSSQKVNVSL